MNEIERRALLGAAGIGAIAALAKAGPLNPPAGAVASTGKTLTEVEPRTAINAVNTPGTATGLFRITQPGSYYLTGNITGVAGRNGIEIVSDDVTIDLMGFKLLGVAGSLSGIATAALLVSDRITIRNGTVNGWGGYGVYLSGGGGTGVGSVIEDVEASNNGDRGFYTNLHSVMRRCVARNNATEGMLLVGTATVESCEATDNAENGIYASGATTISGCTADGNGAVGIQGGNAAAIVNCSAKNNTLSGIVAGTGAVVRGCAASTNGASGIVTSASCTVESCSSINNSTNGFTVSLATLIRGCVAAGNISHGISCSSDSLVTGNTTDGNTLAGIHSGGSDSRFIGNHCTDNGTGILLTINGNIVTGNTCANNATNYNLAANNYHGAIVSRVGVATVAVNGSSAVSNLTTTDPHANFAY